MAGADANPERRDERAADRDDAAADRDELSAARDEQADQRDAASTCRDLDARDRMEPLAGRIRQAGKQLDEHLRGIEATEPDPVRRTMLAQDRALISDLLGSVLVELQRGRGLRWAARQDRDDAAIDRHASAADRAASSDDRFGALGDREQSAIEREQAYGRQGEDEN